MCTTFLTFLPASLIGAKPTAYCIILYFPCLLDNLDGAICLFLEVIGFHERIDISALFLERTQELHVLVLDLGEIASASVLLIPVQTQFLEDPLCGLICSVSSLLVHNLFIDPVAGVDPTPLLHSKHFDFHFSISVLDQPMFWFQLY